MEFAVEAQKLLGVSLEGRRLTAARSHLNMLSIEDLHVEVDGKAILRG